MIRKPPDDELRRVADYWQQVRVLVCEHEEWTFTGVGPPVCSKCERPLQVLSDLQIEHLREGGGDG